MMLQSLVLITVVSIPFISCYQPSPIWCYRCVSTHPGCGMPFNWLWNWSQECPERGDKCVKIIETKGGDEIITRDCLSAIRGHRTDIPADQYEGCRSHTKDVHLANYVNNSIKELDVKRDFYDSVRFCFCYFDNRCNGAASFTISRFSIIASIVLSLFPIVMRR